MTIMAPSTRSLFSFTTRTQCACWSQAFALRSIYAGFRHSSFAFLASSPHAHIFKRASSQRSFSPPFFCPSSRKHKMIKTTMGSSQRNFHEAVTNDPYLPYSWIITKTGHSIEPITDAYAAKKESTEVLHIKSAFPSNVQVIALNRPKALNALNQHMCLALRNRILRVERAARRYDPSKTNTDLAQLVSALVIKSTSSPKAFCAGGDVKSIAKALLAGDPSVGINFFDAEYAMNYALATTSVPLITIMDGITMGGGVGIAIHGNYRIATENTVFAMPECAIGLHPDVGGSYFLPKLEASSQYPGLGNFLALTGARIKAKDTLALGIATHYIPSKSLPGFENAITSVRSKNPNFIEDSLWDAGGISRAHLKEVTLPSDSILSNVDQIAECFTADSVEEIISRLKRRLTETLQTESKAQFIKLCLNSLEQASPTALKVALESLKRGAKLNNFKDSLIMEHRISSKFMSSTQSDFAEGVRALLIDKDMKPKWNPSSLDQVSDSLVQSYFELREGGKDLELVNPFIDAKL